MTETTTIHDEAPELVTPRDLMETAGLTAEVVHLGGNVYGILVEAERIYLVTQGQYGDGYEVGFYDHDRNMVEMEIGFTLSQAIVWIKERQ